MQSQAETEFWSATEDDLLRKLIVFEVEKNWNKIAWKVGTKSVDECKHRWKQLMQQDEKYKVRGRWTPEEDERLSNLIAQHGTSDWRLLAAHLPGRQAKQCRERWYNQLDPKVKKDGLTPEEWTILIDAHSRLGNRWAELVTYLPGRTANHLKNQWNTMIRRRETDNTKKRKFDNLSDESETSFDSSTTISSPLQRFPLSPDSSDTSSASSSASSHSPQKRSKLVDDLDSDSDEPSTALDVLVQASLGVSSVTPSPAANMPPSGQQQQRVLLAPLTVPSSLRLLMFHPSALPYLPALLSGGIPQ